ncbi:MAG: HTH domain-containing protein [Bacteroidales bacterium]
MTYSSNYLKVNYLLDLLSNKNAGTAKELAKRLQISERTVKRKLKDIREIGYDVRFDRKAGTYYINN